MQPFNLSCTGLESLLHANIVHVLGCEIIIFVGYFLMLAKRKHNLKYCCTFSPSQYYHHCDQLRHDCHPISKFSVSLLLTGGSCRFINEFLSILTNHWFWIIVTITTVVCLRGVVVQYCVYKVVQIMLKCHVFVFKLWSWIASPNFGLIFS